MSRWPRNGGNEWRVAAVVALCGIGAACGAATTGAATPNAADELRPPPDAPLAAAGETGPAPSERGASAGGAPRLWLDGASFLPGEPITVHFTAPASFAADAWIGILPSSTPHGSEAVCDQADVSYEHLGGRTSGTVMLTAPARLGPWDVRMFDTDQNGREAAATRFQVRGR